MWYKAEDALLQMSVEELSAFVYSCENPLLLSETYGFISWDKSSENNVNGFITDHPLQLTLSVEELHVEIVGTADTVSHENNHHTVEVCHSVRSFPQHLSPFTNPDTFGKAVCLGHILCKTRDLSDIGIKISYIRQSDSCRKSFYAVFPSLYLQKVFTKLIKRALPFMRLHIERCTVRLDELAVLPFPYRSIREGQSHFITESYRTIKSGGRLFVSAPTGIGKTISSLYPALRSIGTGLVDKVFYLTAKTITGKVAVDTARKLSAYAPHFRTVLLLAKDSMCGNINKSPDIPSSIRCPFCSNRKDIGTSNDYKSIRQRQHEAILALLNTGKIYTPDLFKAIASQFNVCPHELALDVSEYCDLIVCDYNYVFDDRVRLHRYFKDVSRQERYVFCIDEAHNLPDRARATYSATLTTHQITSLTSMLSKQFSDDPPVIDAISATNNAFQYLLSLCSEESSVSSHNGESIQTGYYKNNETPEEFTKALSSLLAVLNRLLRSNNDLVAEIMPYRSLISDFLSATMYADNHFCFFSTSENQDVTAQILCLDPAGIIDSMLNSAKASILFSATLSPIEYYQSVTGSLNSNYLDLPSPYASDNLCLMAFDGISTRFNDRKGTREDAAEIIARAVSIKEGKYIVYLPSYDYLQTVCRKFHEIMPDIPVIMQKKSMSYKEREQFIRIFSGSKYSHVVGFCVLGGMFSEGIDLHGDSLIGAIIIGTGLPGLSSELNLVAEYYQNTVEKGREFAYVYPGMNKVLQAAGRVIRSEADRGMVLLIDDRYSSPEMKLLFPPHWDHIRFTKNPTAIEKILKDFWE